jgi:peptidoglycan/xylan/chitin deacetylase (PgdA/CDA1 family)
MTFMNLAFDDIRSGRCTWRVYALLDAAALGAGIFLVMSS